MKSINVLLAGIFLAFSASLQAQVDTLSSKTLLMKGKMRKVEDFSFLLKPDPKGEKKFDDKNYNVFPYAEEWGLEKDATRSSKTNIVYIFDNSGKNLEIITYNVGDQPFGGMCFFHDKGGHINRSRSVLTADDGEFTADRKYFYNEKNQLVEVDGYDDDTWSITITYKHSDWGNCIERNRVASVFALEKDIQRYEEKDLILGRKIRPEYTRERSYTYDNINKVTVTESKVLEKNVFLRTQNEYDEEGRLSKTAFLNEAKQETVCTYEYNEAEQLIQSICMANDDPSFCVKANYVFNKSGEAQVVKTRASVASTKVFGKHNLLTTYTTPEFDYKYHYSFDKMGNWTQVLMYENGKPICTCIRKIEYFK